MTKIIIIAILKIIPRNLPVQFLRHEGEKRLVRWRLPGIISTSQTDYMKLKPEKRSQEDQHESPQ